jgi:hypothetical protein
MHQSAGSGSGSAARFSLFKKKRELRGKDLALREIYYNIIKGGERFGIKGNIMFKPNCFF